jgi:hypothetical protein
MQYMLMFHEETEEFSKRDDPQHSQAYWGAWTAYVASLGQAGVVVSGNGLQPPTSATSVSMREGRRVIQDGPFSDSKEHLGGYFIIEVANLDEALEWAARSPNVHHGHTEVRPVLPPPQA